MNLRPRNADDLGLRRALPGRLLGAVTSAMVLLAGLALGTAAGASALAQHWRVGAASLITVQVPDTGRAPAVEAALHQVLPGASLRRIPPSSLAQLLQPWLGTDPAALGLDLPAVFALTAPDPGQPLDAAVARAAPGSTVTRHAPWLRRLGALAESLQACAAFALALVGGVAAAMVAIATHGALAASREAVEILHGLGASDMDIAGRFAGRIAAIALGGAIPGLLVVVPILLLLAGLAAPLAGSGTAADVASLARDLPSSLWAGLAMLPPLAGLIGAATAYLSVRLWLLRLP